MLIPYNQRRLKKMSTKSYNMNAEQGVDDMEFVEEFNLDPAVAYTPKINDVMLQYVYEGNLDSINKMLLGKGYSAKEAGAMSRKQANNLLKEGQESVKTLYKQRKKK